MRTNNTDISELLSALGYEIQLVDDLNKRIRYAGETNFVDIWNGKKGITVGIYNPKTDRMKYIKNCNLEAIEEAICG